MAKHNHSHHSQESEPRPETAPEFSRRVQDTMDSDSWQGVDRVGNEFPEPAEIVEYPADRTTRIYRRKDGV